MTLTFTTDRHYLLCNGVSCGRMDSVELAQRVAACLTACEGLDSATLTDGWLTRIIRRAQAAPPCLVEAMEKARGTSVVIAAPQLDAVSESRDAWQAENTRHMREAEDMAKKYREAKAEARDRDYVLGKVAWALDEISDCIKSAPDGWRKRQCLDALERAYQATAVPREEVERLLRDRSLLVSFAKTIASDYDHEQDAHKYNSGACRCCKAEGVLEQVGEDQPDDKPDSRQDA